MQSKGGKDEQKRDTSKSKMADINPAVSIMTLNVSGLNNPIKSQRLSDWIKSIYRIQPHAL